MFYTISSLSVVVVLITTFSFFCILYSLVNIHLYMYIYANVLNYILFQSILTQCTLHVLCSKKTIYIIHACIIIIFILYSLPYSICIIAVILNTLYACYGFMLSRCFILVCRKIAQMS